MHKQIPTPEHPQREGRGGELSTHVSLPGSSVPRGKASSYHLTTHTGSHIWALHSPEKIEILNENSGWHSERWLWWTSNLWHPKYLVLSLLRLGKQLKHHWKVKHLKRRGKACLVLELLSWEEENHVSECGLLIHIRISRIVLLFSEGKIHTAFSLEGRKYFLRTSSRFIHNARPLPHLPLRP